MPQLQAHGALKAILYTICYLHCAAIESSIVVYGGSHRVGRYNQQFAPLT